MTRKGTTRLGVLLSVYVVSLWHCGAGVAETREMGAPGERPSGANVAVGEAPTLLRSEPADGTKDVRPDIGVICLHFGRNMKMNTWTLWNSDKGEFPPLDGPNDAPWRDPQTFELKIQGLKPTTTYAVQLNSESRQGFRSAGDDVTPPIAVVVFQTAEAAETSEKPPETKRVTPLEKEAPVKPSRVGIWVFRNAQREMRVEFQRDGGYTYSIRSPEETSTVKGTYRILANEIELRPEDEPEPVRLTFRFVDDNTFEVEEEGETYQFKRQATRPRVFDRLTGLPRRTGNKPIVYDQLAPNRTRFKESSSGHILYVRYEVIKVQGGGLDETMAIPKIFIMTGEGEGQAPFIYPKDFSQVLNPWWSPDGKHVLFASDFQSARSALFMDSFLADLESGTVHRITGNEWSAGPVRGTGTIRGTVCAGMAERLNVMDQVCIACQGGGGNVYKLKGVLTGDEYGYTIPNVPAGKLWVKCYVSKHIGDMKMVDLAPGEEVTVDEMDLTAGNFLATNPSITPDGRYLVILSQHAFYNPFVEIKECGFDTIGVCDVEMAGQCVALWDPTRMQGQFAKDPRLSPDGKWIAFSMGDTTMESLAVCSLQSMLSGAPQPRVILPGERVLASHTTAHTNPAWSPDGQRLAVVRVISTTQGFTGNLFVVNSDRSGLRQVTQVATHQCVANPSWSPDGKRIAFQLVTSRRPALDITDLLTRNIVSDIWTIRADGSDPRQLTNDGRSAEPAWGP
jgi:hypothetical protein